MGPQVAAMKWSSWGSKESNSGTVTENSAVTPDVNAIVVSREAKWIVWDLDGQRESAHRLGVCFVIDSHVRHRLGWSLEDVNTPIKCSRHWSLEHVDQGVQRHR